MVAAVRTPVRQGLYQAVSVLVDRSSKIYESTTGKKIEDKTLKFIKELVMSMIGLIDDAVESGGNLDPKSIGKLAFTRALAAAGFVADEKSWNACGIATVSLALSSIDVFGIMTGAVGMSTTGVGAVVGVPLLFASAAFWAYQVNEVVETCGEAYVSSAERRFASIYNVAGKRAMMKNYGEMVCR